MIGYYGGTGFLIVSGLLWSKPGIVTWLYDHTTLLRIGGEEALDRRNLRAA